MKRADILTRLGFSVGSYKKNRVLILSDIKTEADDPFAIVHHLLSPTENVRGIVACHFESKYGKSPRLAHLKGTSAEQSYIEGQKILEYMEMEDVPLVRGTQYPLTSDGSLPESEGAELIIREALQEDEMPLYIACLGALTDLAVALKKEPRIAKRMTAIFIGGAPYPDGGMEPNVEEDVLAAQIVFDSEIPLWQIPSSVYSTVEISLAEVVAQVKPCGKIGAYLCQEMLEVNDFYAQVPSRMPWPHGETWSIGDNPSVFVLLQSQNRCTWHTRKAPGIADDMSYIDNPNGRDIRVYDTVDCRLGISDFLSKLRLCYGTQV